MNSPHMHADMIKAWADGCEIEFRNNHHDAWRDCESPIWDKYCEYRVKPRVLSQTFYIPLHQSSDGIKMFHPSAEPVGLSIKIDINPETLAFTATLEK